MATQYTSILKLALPVQGELSGTWGTAVNEQVTSMVEEAIAGLKTINTWSTNSATLSTADGATSESRAAILNLTDTTSDLSGAATLICPAASKVYIVKNSTGQAVTVKTASGTGIAIPNGLTGFVFCDGTNVVEAINNVTGNLTIGGNASIGGNLTVTGTTTFNGGTLTLGDADTDNIVFGGEVDSNIIPDDNNTYDLGSSGKQWKDIYIDGVAYLDAIDFNGTAISSTAAELNILDGVTSTAAELNILDGVTSTTAELNILDGVTSTTAELNILDGVTSTTAELNILDGVTSTTAELNILDGVTSTAAELNILDGVTSTAAELNILDGVTASAADINLIDGITNGTVIASKAIITDSNKDITGGRNITISGELDAATLDISGNADIDGTLETDALSIDGTTVTATAAELNILDGVTASATDINLIDGITNGTVIASKAIITDSNKDITGGRNITISGELDAATLDISGNADIDGTLETDALSIDGTTVTATAAELNILDGVTASATDINLIDGITNGTVIASKAIITDANKDITGGRNITISGELDAATLDISGDADIDGTLEADAITVNGTALNTVIAGVTVANATLAATTTVTNSTANTNFPVVFHDESNALLDDTGALRYNPSTGELLVPKLTVAGTTTTVDTVTMNAQNAIIFEGATADANETTLTIIDPTSDHTINLPNASGTIPVLAAASTTAITSTPAELNVLDGITAVVGELNALDIGSTAVGTAVASKAVILDSNKDYTGIRNFTITGELDAATLDISGDVDVDGTLETDALSINGTAVTSTAAELNILDGVTASATDINLIDGITNGTVIASKAVITDSNKDITGGRNITISGELDAGSLDISGNADIDGTLEADAISINGTTITSTAAELNILDGVTSTAAELNILDGVTSTAAELNALDGITAVVGELNALDLGSTAVGTAIASKAMILDSNKDYTGVRNFTLSGELDAGSLDISGDVDVDGTLETDAFSIAGTTVTSTAAELNVLDGITAVVGELNALDIGSTAIGTAVASKAVILDSNKDYTGIRNFTISGELDAATGDFSGNVDVDGTLEADAITVNGTALNTVIADEATALAIALG